MGVFSTGELRRRLLLAQEAMETAQVDCLFLTSDENFHYFTGGAGLTQMRSYTRPNIVIVPAEGEPIVITGAAFTYIIKEAGLVKDIRTYTSTSGVPNDLLVKALNDVGLRNGRIGIEMGLDQRLNMPLKDYFQLAKTLSNVQFVDETSIIWDLRMVKSDEEVQLMRESCNIISRARQKTIEEVRIGITERQIVRLFARHMLEEGADRISKINVAFGLPANHSYIYLDRPLKSGDILFLDGGAYVYTYTSEYSRVAIAGLPSAEQKHVHETLLGANDAMADSLRPGVTCADVFKTGAKILGEAQIADFGSRSTGRIGHGQGILPVEPPSISASDKTVLKPGMIITVEAGAPEAAGGVFILEDVYLITNIGAERLSTEENTFKILQV